MSGAVKIEKQMKSTHDIKVIKNFFVQEQNQSLDD